MQVEGGPPPPGTPLRARILDVSKDTGIVDVSLKPAQLSAAAAAAASEKGKAKGKAGGPQGDKQKKSKKRKAEEALDAAHAEDSLPKVGLPSKRFLLAFQNLYARAMHCHPQAPLPQQWVTLTSPHIRHLSLQ